MHTGPRIFHFGGLSLDTERRIVVAASGPVPITTRAFDLLEYLVRRAGETVPRDDIVRVVWRGVNVGENNLSVQISILRRQLCAHGGDTSMILNVPGQGYRFVAEVTKDTADPVMPRILPGDTRSDAVGAMAADPMDSPVKDASAVGPNSWRSVVRRHRAMFATCLAALLVVALVASVLVPFGHETLGGGEGAQRSSDERLGTRVAVQAFELIGTTSLLRNFAEGLSDELLGVLTSSDLPTLLPRDADTLEGPGSDARLQQFDVGLVFNGTVRAVGSGIAVRIRLDDPIHHAVLWSAEITGPSDRPEILQAQIAARAIPILSCSSRALRPGGLYDPAVLALYLHACDLYESDNNTGDLQIIYPLLDTMRRVTARAPFFADGHAALAKFDAYYESALPLDQQPAIHAEASRQIEAARAIDPNNADSFVAEAELAPPADFEARENALRRAVAADPAWPPANKFLGKLLVSLGRLNQATPFLTRARAVSPESLDWAGELPNNLARTGQFAAADLEFQHLHDLWPRQFYPYYGLVRSLLAQRRWDDALALLDRGQVYVARADVIAGYRAIALAMKSGDATQADQAAGLVRDAAHDETRAYHAIVGLCLLSRVDDAFDMATRNIGAIAADDDLELLFDAETAAMRRDPRFMSLVASSGILEHWQRTGIWPDFCSDPKLPYVCSKAAAKLVESRLPG